MVHVAELLTGRPCCGALKRRTTQSATAPCPLARTDSCPNPLQAPGKNNQWEAIPAAFLLPLAPTPTAPETRGRPRRLPLRHLLPAPPRCPLYLAPLNPPFQPADRD